MKNNLMKSDPSSQATAGYAGRVRYFPFHLFSFHRFLLEFIPMKIGTGMTRQEIASPDKVGIAMTGVDSGSESGMTTSILPIFFS